MNYSMAKDNLRTIIQRDDLDMEDKMLIAVSTLQGYGAQQWQEGYQKGRDDTLGR